MDEDDLGKWCSDRGYQKVKFINVAPARLNGYKLSFNYFSKCRWKAGTANIMKSRDDCVPGLLVEIEDKDLDKIREKESHPNYYHEIRVNVEKLDKTFTQNVVTYKVVKHREESKHQPPMKYYLQLMIKSARRYGFPDDYVNYLELTETVD